MSAIVDIIEDNLVDGKMAVRTQAAPDVYFLLREAIVSGEFHPNERLVEASIASKLGAGRTAVRAALVRLDQEGLVILEPNRGARVRLISEAEALEIEEVRATLEGMLAYRAATRASEEAIQQLQQVLDEMRRHVEGKDPLGYSELNVRFHQLIWTAADHQTASRLVGGLKSQSIRFQYRTILRPDRTSSSLREHQAIVAAIKARDASAAEAAMGEHLAAVLETLRWAMDGHNSKTRWLPG